MVPVTLAALMLSAVKPDPLPVAVPEKVMSPAWLTENLLEPLTCRSVRLPLNPPAVLTVRAVPAASPVPNVLAALKVLVPFFSGTLLER